MVKLSLLYGLGISIGGAVLILILYFLGYHSDLDKFIAIQTPTMLISYAIIIVGLVLGMRAVREQSPDHSLSYGRAVGTGALITLFSGLFSAVFVLIYGLVLNPEYHDLIYRMQLAKMEEKGVPPDQMDAAEPMMRLFSGPVFMALMAVIMSPIFGTLLSLIIAIFVKRAPATTPPPIGSARA